MLSNVEYFKSGNVKIGGVAVEIGEGDIVEIRYEPDGRKGKVYKDRLLIKEVAYENGKPWLVYGVSLTLKNKPNKRVRGYQSWGVEHITGIIEKGYFAETEER